MTKQFMMNHPENECDITVVVDSDYRIESVKYSGTDENVILIDEEIRQKIKDEVIDYFYLKD